MDIFKHVIAQFLLAAMNSFMNCTKVFTSSKDTALYREALSPPTDCVPSAHACYDVPPPSQTYPLAPSLASHPGTRGTVC